MEALDARDEQEARDWESKLADIRKGAFPLRRSIDADAEREWKAQQAADEFQMSGGLYAEAAANHRREFPWLYDHSIPEPSDPRAGDDVRITETDVDYPVRPGPDFPGVAA